MPVWRIDSRLDDWLDHHSPGGVRVVPGAALVGWMLEASGGDEWLSLREVRFLRPVRVAGEGAEVRLEAEDLTGDDRFLRLFEGRSAESPACTSRVGPCSISEAAPDPLPFEGSRSEPVPETFHGSLLLGFSPPLRLHATGLDGAFSFPADRPERLPRLGSARGPDSRHLDAVFQSANHLRQLSALPRGVPVAAEEIHVHRTRAAAGDLTVRARWRSPGTEERIDVWCGDAAGRPVILLRGYLGAPAAFAPGSV